MEVLRDSDSAMVAGLRVLPTEQWGQSKTKANIWTKAKIWPRLPYSLDSGTHLDNFRMQGFGYKV